MNYIKTMLDIENNINIKQYGTRWVINYDKNDNKLQFNRKSLMITATMINCGDWDNVTDGWCDYVMFDSYIIKLWKSIMSEIITLNDGITTEQMLTYFDYKDDISNVKSFEDNILLCEKLINVATNIDSVSYNYIQAFANIVKSRNITIELLYNNYLVESVVSTIYDNIEYNMSISDIDDLKKVMSNVPDITYDTLCVMLENRYSNK